MSDISRNYQLSNESIYAQQEKHLTEMNKIAEELSDVMDCAENIIGIASASGKAAEAMKTYYRMAHQTILSGILAAIAVHDQKILLYVSDCLNIDSHPSALIKDARLQELTMQLDKTMNSFAGRESDVHRVINKVSDLVQVTRPRVDAVGDAHTAATGSIISLAEKIHAVQDNHLKDFDESHEHIQASLGLIETCLDPGNFSDTFALEPNEKVLSAFARFSDSSQEMAREYDEDSAKIEDALKVIEDYEVRVVEERQKTADLINLGVDIGCAIIGGIATATLGPAGVIIACGITGAVKGATKGLTAEYVTHGNLIDNADKIDWGSVGQEALIGGITGASGAAIGQGFKAIGGSTAFTKIFGEKGGTKLLGDCIVGTTENMTKGVCTRFEDKLFRTGDPGAAVKTAFKPEDLFKDGIKGTSDALIGEVADKIYKPNANEHAYIRNGMKGGGQSVAEGITDRAVEQGVNAMTGKEVELDKIVEGKEILNDFGTGAGKSMGSQVKTENQRNQMKADREAQRLNEKMNKQTDQLQEAQNRGITGVERTKNNGLDYKNSNVIARTPDGKPVQVTIEATGDRQKDMRAIEEACQKQYGFNSRSKTTGGGDGPRYKWTSLDDYNVKEGKYTVQLVDADKTAGFGGATAMDQYREVKGSINYTGFSGDSHEKGNIKGLFNFPKYGLDTF